MNFSPHRMSILLTGMSLLLPILVNAGSAPQLCEGIYVYQDLNTSFNQSILNSKITQQIGFAQQAISEDFGYPEKTSLKNKLSALKFWSDLPIGSISSKAKPDNMDLALFDLTNVWKSEYGRIEVRNAKGEILGLSIFTSGGDRSIEGSDISNALARAYGQAWATGEFFEIRTVSFTHTHPGFGDSSVFSDGDISLFKHIKAQMEATGLKDADLEASILFENFWTNIAKKCLLVPASSSVASGSYKSANVESLSKQMRLALMIEVAQIGDKVIHGELTKNELFTIGLPLAQQGQFQKMLRSRFAMPRE